MHFSPEIHKLKMLWRASCRDEARRNQLLQSPFELASPFFADCPGLQTIISVIHCDTRWYKFIIKYTARFENIKTIFSVACLLMRTSFCFEDIPHSARGFRVVLEKSTFVTCYDPSKKILFLLELFKNICRNFVLT